MDIQAISVMLKDHSDKREADINRLVTRLADALTPLIADHMKRYGLPGTTRPLQFVPSNTEMFVNLRDYQHLHDGRHILTLRTQDSTLQYHHNRQRRKRLDESKELIVPLVEILQRLTSLYRESGFILDLTPNGRVSNRNPPAYQSLSLDVKLRPIQASDKPSEP